MERAKTGSQASNWLFVGVTDTEVLQLWVILECQHARRDLPWTAQTNDRESSRIFGIYCRV